MNRQHPAKSLPLSKTNSCRERMKHIPQKRGERGEGQHCRLKCIKVENSKFHHYADRSFCNNHKKEWRSSKKFLWEKKAQKALREEWTETGDQSVCVDVITTCGVRFDFRDDHRGKRSKKSGKTRVLNTRWVLGTEDEQLVKLTTRILTRNDVRRSESWTLKQTPAARWAHGLNFFCTTLKKERRPHPITKASAN